MEDRIKKELEVLKNQQAQILAQLNAITGAIKILEQLLNPEVKEEKVE